MENKSMFLSLPYKKLETVEFKVLVRTRLKRKYVNKKSVFQVMHMR
jgi:hypothetical protein